MRFRDEAKLDTTQIIDLRKRKRGAMSTPEPLPTRTESLRELFQEGVRGILAIGSFAVLSVLVVTGNAEDIPREYLLLAGAAIGIFIGGNPFKK